MPRRTSQHPGSFIPAGQHHHAILVSFALARNDQLALEVDIFHSLTKGFHQTHPGAISQAGKVGHSALDCGEHGAHFLPRQNRRQTNRSFWTLEFR